MDTATSTARVAGSHCWSADADMSATTNATSTTATTTTSTSANDSDSDDSSSAGSRSPERARPRQHQFHYYPAPCESPELQTQQRRLADVGGKPPRALGTGARDWAFVQSFGDDSAPADDAVTALAFSGTGRHVAVGDAAGRVCLLSAVPPSVLAPGACVGEDRPAADYAVEFSLEFQSHEPEVDILSSKTVSPAVTNVTFLDQAAWRPGPRLQLLASNTSTIKLWSVSERTQRAVLRRTFQNEKTYELHSVLPCADGETILAVDELRVNQWHLGLGSDRPLTLLDCRPQQPGAGITEVITSAAAHSTNSNLFALGMSSGDVRVYDKRERCRLSAPAVSFRVPAADARSSAVTSVSFVEADGAGAGFGICARNYFGVYKWDAQMQADGGGVAHSVTSADVQPFLRPFVSELCDNGCAFDTFGCGVSPDGRAAVTGSYGGRFAVVSLAGTAAPKRSTVYMAQDEDSGLATEVGEVPAQDANKVNLGHKALHTAWHPTRGDVMAVAALNKIYIYCEARDGGPDTPSSRKRQRTASGGAPASRTTSMW